MIVIKKIKLYQDPELDEEGRPITKPLTEEEIIIIFPVVKNPSSSLNASLE